MGLVSLFHRYQEKKQLRRFQAENEWEGLVPGDVVEYRGQKYLYRGVNPNGGPGMPGFPEPVFGATTPAFPDMVFYLRTEFSYPFDAFDKIPDRMKESARPAMAGDTGTYIAFLNATRKDLKKVGHITPGEWRQLLKKEN